MNSSQSSEQVTEHSSDQGLTVGPKLIGPAIRRDNPTLHIVGVGLLFISPGMLLAGFIEWGSSTSHDEWPLFLSALLTAGLGLLFWGTTSIKDSINVASIFSAVAWTWVACSVLGAIPYILVLDTFGWGGWDRALFESISGFSCTGSTILSDIEGLGRGVLFWRQLTQWYGGMGMVVLALSVLPYVGVGGMGLMAAEAPGQTAERLGHRVSETARQLWLIYAGITLIIAAALFITPGPNLYDSVAHALSTSSTGGFSPYNQSLGHFDSVGVELIIGFFLIFCALSFNLHYRAIQGDLSTYWRHKDHAFFLKIVVISMGLVTLLNWNSSIFEGFWNSLRYAFFNVATLISSGGFSNATGSGSDGDFAVWAPSVQMILLILMVMGGSVGSTSGGMKAYRVHVASKHIKNSLLKTIHPNIVTRVKLGRVSVPEDIVRRVLGFVTLYVMFIIGGTLILASLGNDLVVSLSGAISAMGNMGPALGEAGPTSNFLEYSRPARGVLMALMLIGRLEIMAALFMFVAPLRAVRGRSKKLLVN